MLTIKSYGSFIVEYPNIVFTPSVEIFINMPYRIILVFEFVGSSLSIVENPLQIFIWMALELSDQFNLDVIQWC